MDQSTILSFSKLSKPKLGGGTLQTLKHPQSTKWDWTWRLCELPVCFVEGLPLCVSAACVWFFTLQNAFIQLLSLCAPVCIVPESPAAILRIPHHPCLLILCLGEKENLIKPTRLFDWWGICSKDFSILLNYCSVTSNKGLEFDQIEIKPKLELWFKIGFGLPTVDLQHFCLLKDYFLILTIVKSMVLI